MAQGKQFRKSPRRLCEVDPTVAPPPGYVPPQDANLPNDSERPGTRRVDAIREYEALKHQPEILGPDVATTPLSAASPQDIAVQELARSCSPRRAALRAGVPLEQVKQWMRDPLIMEQVQEERMAGVVETAFIIARLAPKAARTLAEEMKKTGNRNPGGQRRMRAASKLLEFFNKSVELLQLVPQLRELERTLSERGIALPAAPEPRAIDTSIVDAEYQVHAENLK